MKERKYETLKKEILLLLSSLTKKNEFLEILSLFVLNHKKYFHLLFDYLCSSNFVIASQIKLVLLDLLSFSVEIQTVVLNVKNLFKLNKK